MSANAYYMMCEQMGTEPKPEEIPLEYNDFPYPVQVAISIYSILPDRIEGMSGTYLGKDYSLIPYLLKDIYEIDNEAQIFQFINIINNIVVKKAAVEQKRRDRKNKGSKGIK